MREELKILASLQEVDRELRDKTGAKGALLAEIQRKEEEIGAKRAEAAGLGAEWTERDKLRQQKEKLLQEEGRKTAEKRMRMSRIKNIKELQALQREIDQIKLGNAQLEEELLALMEELESRAAPLREKEAGLKKIEEDWAKRRAEIEAECAEIEKKVADVVAARKDLAAQVSEDLRGRYDLIFSRRGGMAVVGVSDGICQGCFMHVRPQLLNEVIKGEGIHLCPSCHRILYYKPTVPDDKQL